MYISAVFSLGLAVLPFIVAKRIEISVGEGGGLTFSPEAVFADPGDDVFFTFRAKNHSVTQSSLDSPCGPRSGGIDSGFNPVAPGAATLPTFNIHVHNKDPIWIHCRQAAGTDNSHCGKGMVFAINCGPDGAPNSFQSFKAAAIATLNKPGSPPPAPGSPAPGSPAPGSTTVWTAAYGTATIPPPDQPVDVTQTVTLGSSTWVTAYPSYPNSPAPTPVSPEGKTHKVTVGKGALVFDPERVDALPFDKIEFEFYQKNHSVIQSDFRAPCIPLNDPSQPNPFNSGFFPVPDNATTFPTWTLTINDTRPIWAYCGQKGHCAQGMVFAVNSNERGERNFTAFKDLAKKLNGTVGAVATNTAPDPSRTSSAAMRTTHVGGLLTLVFAAIGCALL